MASLILSPTSRYRRPPLSLTARRAFRAALGLACAVPLAAFTATGPEVSGFEAYDREIPALLAQAGIPGAAVAVAFRGRIVFARGYGYADRESLRPVQPDTRFRIGSVSKPLTASMVLSLVEQGRLALDDRAFPMLGYPTPAYTGARRDPRLDRITVRQLLNHTGGWDATIAPNTVAPNQIGFDATQWQADVARVMRTAAPARAETVVRFMVGQPLQFEPGTRWMYANVGYLALGRLIEQKTGLPYEAAVQQFVAPAYVSGLAIGGSHRHELGADEAVYYDYPGAPLQPVYLGAGNARVPQPYMWSYPGFDASGGWCMSAIEVVRFLLALEGRSGTPALLRPETLTTMRTATPLSTFLGYGLGWCTTNGANTDPPGTDSGHGGDNWGTKAWALRSQDGDWHIVALLNGSVNLGKLGDVNRMNQAASAVLHRLPDFASRAPAHDLTWSTLGWGAWQRRHFGGDVSPLADADGDGLCNVLEYAAGLHPSGLDAQPPASLALDASGAPVFTHRRLILEHPFAWTIETTNDGDEWEPANTAPESSSTWLNADGSLSLATPVTRAERVRVRVRHTATQAEASFEPSCEPQHVVLREGETATLRAFVRSGTALQWRRNGVLIPGATTGEFLVTNAQPADAGIYTIDSAEVVPAHRVVAIVAIRSTAKVIGAAELAGTDIRHANGNIYDQWLLTGAAATITADTGQVTRISYVDLNDDIVQVEFSGSGCLTVALSNPATAAPPRHYRQDVRYVKGHATILVADADADTHVSVFSVGRANAVNQALFIEGVEYDGIADLAAIAVQSASGKAGGLYLGNAHLFAASGSAGVHAAGVAFGGAVRLGDLGAFDDATPALLFGSVDEVAITGGDLFQDNGAAVQTRGVPRIALRAGAKSDGTSLPAQPSRGRLTLHGYDVTDQLIVR